MPTLSLVFVVSVICLHLSQYLTICESAPIHRITIDGNFDDWKDIPSYYDPDDAEDGSVMDGDAPDCHDTDHETIDNPPDHVYNENVNILEYKVAHDETSLYVYIRAKGYIGKTGSEGRFYVITTIDVDQDDSTGYWLHEGGYWPTSTGYDVNMEMEFYEGRYNHASYLNHGCNDSASYDEAYLANIQGVTNIHQGNYSYYTEYDYWPSGMVPTADEQQRCQDGMYILPSGDEYICFSTDKAPGPFYSAITYGQSEDGYEIEYAAPYVGFMKDVKGEPIMALGKTLDISISLECSGEYSSPCGVWASDTAAPIQGYVLGRL